MTPSRVILMGDPSCFAIRQGANPHTRNRWGMKKRVDGVKAKEQWVRMVEALRKYGVIIHVIPPDPELPGLVFPANAGVVLDPERPLPIKKRTYLLANLSPARSQEQKIYRDFIQGLGVKIESIRAQFEGEADLLPWGDRWIFTYGRIEKNRWAPRWGLPPWRRIFGFRSGPEALGEIRALLKNSEVLPLELSQEAFYHGDTVLASFGPRREFLLAYKEGLKPEHHFFLEGNPHVLWISKEDAWKFAANAFQVIHEGKCVLFMPEGISRDLQNPIESKGIQIVPINVSEFFEKGGGSVKCLIGDLGAWAP